MLALLLVFAQTFALFLAPAHRIAHAALPVTAIEHAASASHGSPSLFDWFGHQAGGGCADWNAAFAFDFNPGSGQGHAKPIAASLPTFCGHLPAPTASHPPGLSLARAPPRA